MTFLENVKTHDQQRLLGESLVEYVREAHHMGMDGFTSADQTGIWRLLDDVCTYMEQGEGEPTTSELYRQWRP